MVLSGWSASDQELTDSSLCRHCFTCFNVRKCARDSRDAPACPILECERGCGWVYHACKGAEHADLCPLVLVDCINKEFGCGLQLLRRDVVSHLPSCPANIITCTQEWNRSVSLRRQLSVSLRFHMLHIIGGPCTVESGGRQFPLEQRIPKQTEDSWTMNLLLETRKWWENSIRCPERQNLP